MAMTAEQQQALDALSALSAQGMAQGALPQAEPIGGFWAGPQGDPNSPDWQGVPFNLPPKQGSLPKPYYEGDDTAILSSMNTEQLARLQDTLVATGLVREVIPGRIDDGTRKGLQTLMALGNRQSVTWQSVLDGIQRAGGVPGATADAPEFDPDPYLAPDVASIAQDIKQTFRDRLGRDPDENEMAQLSAELFGYDRARYDAQTQAQQAQFDAQTTPGTQGGATIQNVDPAARFAEEFERRYANELQFVEDKEDAQESRAVVESGTSTLSQMSRGA